MLLLPSYAVFGRLTRSQDTFSGSYNNDRHRERRWKSTYLDLAMSKGDVSLRKPEKRALVSLSRVARAPSAGWSREIGGSNSWFVPCRDSCTWYRDRTMTDVCEIFGYRELQYLLRRLFVRTCAASFAHVKAVKVVRASFFSTTVKGRGRK